MHQGKLNSSEHQVAIFYMCDRDAKFVGYDVLSCGHKNAGTPIVGHVVRGGPAPLLGNRSKVGGPHSDLFAPPLQGGGA